MSNIDRATELLKPNRDWCDQHHKGEGGDPCMFCEYNAGTAARILADAGLLVPDTDHPATLETVEDYVNAPEWTIIHTPSGLPLLKDQFGTWRAAGISTPIESAALALGTDVSAAVLRWGPGEAEQW